MASSARCRWRPCRPSPRACSCRCSRTTATSRAGPRSWPRRSRRTCTASWPTVGRRRAPRPPVALCVPACDTRCMHQRAAMIPRPAAVRSQRGHRRVEGPDGAAAAPGRAAGSRPGAAAGQWQGAEELAGWLAAWLDGRWLLLRWRHCRIHAPMHKAASSRSAPIQPAAALPPSCCRSTSLRTPSPPGPSRSRTCSTATQMPRSRSASLRGPAGTLTCAPAAQGACITPPLAARRSSAMSLPLRRCRARTRARWWSSTSGPSAPPTSTPSTTSCRARRCRRSSACCRWGAVPHHCRAPRRRLAHALPPALLQTWHRQ